MVRWQGNWLGMQVAERSMNDNRTWWYFDESGRPFRARRHAVHGRATLMALSSPSTRYRVRHRAAAGPNRVGGCTLCAAVRRGDSSIQEESGLEFGRAVAGCVAPWEECSRGTCRGVCLAVWLAVCRSVGVESSA